MISEMDISTGEEVGFELAPGEVWNTMEYTIEGDIVREKIYLTSQTLQNIFKVSWVDDVLVFFPDDEYNHKDERKLMLQPVKLVE